MTHTILHADLLAYLRGNQWLAQNGYIEKAHAILCDPPYFLGEMTNRHGKQGSAPSQDRTGGPFQGVSRGFMGKTWDGFESVWHFQAWVAEWAGLLIDFVHPGAVGLFFGGTRTYHRLAAGLEDAGWDVTDCMMWVHGQGFPKSAAIDKLLDKEAGAVREVVGSKGLFPDIRGNSSNGRGMSGPANEGRERLNVPVTAPATPLAARWQGYGTALKPSYESIVVARAPRGKRTYAALAREFGTGALAIDAARIGTDEDRSRSVGKNPNNVVLGRGLVGNGYVSTSSPAGRWPANFALVCACDSDDHADDCPVYELGRQSGERPVSGSAKNGRGSDVISDRSDNLFGRRVQGPLPADEGTAARFFYQAKAARWERSAGLTGFESKGRSSTPNQTLKRLQCSICGCTSTGGDHTGHEPGQMTCGHPKSARIRVEPDPDSYHAKQPVLNHHPTVKPIRLAEYLARLILPPELDEPRHLLVPFAGSGSEMIGALLAGWDVVTGIEREAEYVDLARARVGWWAQFGTYDEARKAYEKAKREPIIIPAPVVIADDKPAQLALFEEAAS